MAISCLLLNFIAVLSPLGMLLAPLFLSVFLITGMVRFGWSKAALVALIGLVPYVILKSPLQGIQVMIPTLFLWLAHGLVRKFRLKPRFNFILVMGALAVSTVLMGVIVIYGFGGMNLSQFVEQIAVTVRESLQGTIATTEGLPPSTLAEFNDIIAMITPQLILSGLAPMLLTWSLIGGYVSMRLAKRHLRGDYGKVPYFSEIHLDPVLILALTALTFLGIRLGGTNGLLLREAGYQLLALLAFINTLSLGLWVLNQLMPKRGSFFKILMLLLISWIIPSWFKLLIAGADSVLDFRNLTGRSLFAWLRYKLHRKED